LFFIRSSSEQSTGITVRLTTNDAFQAEQRQEDENDEHGGVEDGVSNLAGGGGDDFQRGLWRGLGGVLLESAIDVFHIHNRVIHDHADGDGEAAEGHGIQANAEEFKDQNRDRE
jgi:hypothetical protein